MPPSPKKRSVTLRDVARHAGVSASTVSAALNNGDARYNEKTVGRIREIARQLGYRPNRSAQTVRTQRTRLVGMIYFASSMQVANERAHHIGRTIEERNYELLTVDVHWTDGDVSRVVDRLLEARVSGIIVAGVGIDEASISAILEQGIPIIGVSSNHSPRFPLIRSNMYQGIKDLTAHLLEGGCKRLLSLITANFSKQGELAWQQNRQLEGFRDAIIEAGGQHTFGDGPACLKWMESMASEGNEIIGFTRMDPHDVIFFDPFRFARRSVESFKHLPVLPEVIVCPNDDWAVGVISELHTVNRRVPEDILVTGYNDSALAENFPVPITTVRQPTEAMSRMAVDMLIEAIETGVSFPETGIIHELPCEVIHRKSSDAKYLPH